VSVCSVIWRISKVITLFAILVLLMQFRNVLNDVKGGEEEKKEEESQKERIMK
jgi:beta-lactamase regulating signal transducer with metallopeptidase domain